MVGGAVKSPLSLILKTPLPLRATRKGRKRNPWNKTAQPKIGLLKRPAEAEQQHDCCSRLYKQNTIDLLRLAYRELQPGVL